MSDTALNILNFNSQNLILWKLKFIIRTVRYFILSLNLHPVQSFQVFNGLTYLFPLGSVEFYVVYHL
jgi:hypothetical protein